MRFLTRTCFSFGMFFASLLSHGWAPYILSLILFFIPFILSISKQTPKLHINYIVFIALFLILSFANGLYILLDPLQLVIEKAKLAVFGNASMLIFLAGYALMFHLSMSTNERYEQLRYSILFCLIVHLSFFYTQLIFFYFFNIKLDFMAILGGQETRFDNYFADRSNLNFLIFRPSGLFIEPSTYVAAMVVLTALASVVKFQKPLVLIALFSLAFSLSSAGLIMFLLIVAWYIIRNILSFKMILVLTSFSLVLAFTLGDFISFFFDDLSRKVGGGSSYRLELLKYYVLHDTFGLNFFGYGFFGLPNKLDQLLAYTNAAINDIGLGWFTVMKFGIVPAFAFFGLVFFTLQSSFQRIMFTCILLSKSPLVYPLVVLYYVIVLSRQER